MNTLILSAILIGTQPTAVELAATSAGKPRWEQPKAKHDNGSFLSGIEITRGFRDPVDPPVDWNAFKAAREARLAMLAQEKAASNAQVQQYRMERAASLKAKRQAQYQQSLHDSYIQAAQDAAAKVWNLSGS